MLQKQPFLPHFKQRGIVFKYKSIAVHQRYEAAAISIRKGLFKCTLVQARVWSRLILIQSYGIWTEIEWKLRTGNETSVKGSKLVYKRMYGPGRGTLNWAKVLLQNGWNSKQMITLETTLHAFRNQEKTKQRSTLAVWFSFNFFSTSFQYPFKLVLCRTSNRSMFAHSPLGKVCVRARLKFENVIFFSNQSQILGNTHRTFDAYLMNVFEYVRISNARWCSCSKILENRCSYSLDARKICVQHNTNSNSVLIPLNWIELKLRLAKISHATIFWKYIHMYMFFWSVRFLWLLGI